MPGRPRPCPTYAPPHLDWSSPVHIGERHDHHSSTCCWASTANAMVNRGALAMFSTPRSLALSLFTRIPADMGLWPLVIFNPTSSPLVPFGTLIGGRRVRPGLRSWRRWPARLRRRGHPARRARPAARPGPPWRRNRSHRLHPARPSRHPRPQPWRPADWPSHRSLP